jgi:hypothetical protein
LPRGHFQPRNNRLIGFDLGNMRALPGYIVTERCRQLFAVVGEELRIARSARDGGIGHAAVEQIFSAQFRVHVNEEIGAGKRMMTEAARSAPSVFILGVTEVLEGKIKRQHAIN